MWFLLSLGAMFCWSGSDIFSKIGSKQNDKNSHFKMVIAVGVVMGIHALYEILIKGVPITYGAFVQYLPASFLYIAAMIVGYIGLRYIELSVSSPICNSSGALAAAFMLIFFFKKFASDSGVIIGTVFGILLCAGGVIGLGIVESKEDDELRKLRQERANRKYTKSLIAILLPILYCIIDAAGTVADSFILETLDENVANVSYEITFFIMAVLSAIYVYGFKGESFSIKTEWPKGVGGICETAGQVMYIFALAKNPIAAAPVISCYCILSVIWSRIFLKEKLSFKHYIMIAITVCGIVLLGCFGG